MADQTTKLPGLGFDSLSELHPVSRESLSDKIINQIIDLMARDILKPGDRLPSERELCKQFGVGRTSLREGLRSLSVMGVLEGRVGEGTFVSRDRERHLDRVLSWGLLLGPKTARDLVETRLMLESRNAALAADRATDDDLAGIAASVEQMEAAVGSIENSVDDFLDHDLRFHLLIARASQNTILYSLLSTTRGYLHEWIRKSLSGPSSESDDRARLSLRQHGDIAQAIRDRNPDAAQQAMHDHILSSSVDMQSALE